MSTERERAAVLSTWLGARIAGNAARPHDRCDLHRGETQVKRQVLFLQGGGQGAYEADRALAASLQHALGEAFDVRYPRLPEEEDPQLHKWKERIASERGALGNDALLVGHSLGGAVLLKHLAEDGVDRPIAGVFLLAAPAWDPDKWNYDDLMLPADLATRLSNVKRIFLYHNRNDEIVPFAHMARHAARLPQATVRSSDAGGHQFGNDLSMVATDIEQAV